jgi:3-oxoacyl-[acyl-carrier protein] reductase
MQPRIPTYPDLADKVAVVTGSSRGIGAANCRLLAANGVKVVVNRRDRAALQDTVDTIRRDGGDATGITADVTDSDSVDHLLEETERAYGPVDILGAFVAHGGPGVFVPSPRFRIRKSGVGENQRCPTIWRREPDPHDSLGALGGRR